MRYASLSILLVWAAHLGDAYEYKESVEFHTLTGGFVAGHYKFIQSLPILQGNLNSEDVDFGCFPRSIVELVEGYPLGKLRVAFSKGRWYSDVWGVYPLEPSSMGVQVDALLLPDDWEINWKRLTATLAGMFCASINNVDHHSTLYPHFITPSINSQSISVKTTTNYLFLKALLPNEAVCTENLTPWTKLLPCGVSAGLASLLDPQHFFNSSHHTLDVNIDISQDSDGKTVIKLEQNAFFVHQMHDRYDWRLSTLTGSVVERLCPVAAETKLSIMKPQSERWKGIVYSLGSLYAELEKLDFANDEILGQDFGALNSDRLSLSTLSPIPIKVHRRILGMNQHHKGTLAVVWTNFSPDQDIKLNHLEQIPFFMRPFLSSIKIYEENRPESTRIDLLQDLRYTPPTRRVACGQLEMAIRIPAASEIVFLMEFEKEFLRLSEVPRDVFRGIDVSGATIEYINPLNQKTEHIITGKLLFTVAPPDDSMPYNVIAITCSVIIVFHGMLFNLLFRRIYSGDGSRKNRIRRAIVSLFTRLRMQIMKVKRQ